MAQEQRQEQCQEIELPAGLPCLYKKQTKKGEKYSLKPTKPKEKSTEPKPVREIKKTQNKRNKTYTVNAKYIFSDDALAEAFKRHVQLYQ